jgi:hypothetical protein
MYSFHKNPHAFVNEEREVFGWSFKMTSTDALMKAFSYHSHKEQLQSTKVYD